MKKKKVINGLKLRKTNVANLKAAVVKGGYKNDTRRDCVTQFHVCSDVNCYSDACYHTEYTCNALTRDC